MRRIVLASASSPCDKSGIVFVSYYIIYDKSFGDEIGPHSTDGNVSGYRCVSDCRSRVREFDRGPVPYFRVNWS